MGFMSKQMGTWSVVLPFWSENGLWPAVISNSVVLSVNLGRELRGRRIKVCVCGGGGGGI